MTALMKGKVWGEHKHKLKYPVVAEVKYDEIRCCVVRDGYDVKFLSYADKPLHNLDHWHDAFMRLMQSWNLTYLDIGILVNTNFNDSYRWVRSSKGIPAGLETHMVQFILFDIPVSGQPYSTRMKLRADIHKDARNYYGLPMALPLWTECLSESDVEAFFTYVRAEGHEGLMVKSLDHLYQQGKRIDGWLKMKPEDTADGRIIGVVRAVSIHGEPLNRIGSVAVELEDGSKATPAGIPHALGAEMFDHPEKFVGKWIEFKYMEIDRAGGYRHPSFVRFREDKA